MGEENDFTDTGSSARRIRFGLKRPRLSHGSPDARVGIRRTVLQDLPVIFHIRRHPLVQKQHYKRDRNDSLANWEFALFGRKEIDARTYECATIIVDECIVGHVSFCKYRKDGQDVRYCGWDVSPPQWGRGIATGALSLLFDRFFKRDGVDLILAECFRSNRRCVRLMKKLGFQQSGIGGSERLAMLIDNRCLRWIHRFRITKDQW